MMRDSSNDHLLGNFALFAVLLLLSATLLVVALLLWLAEILGSPITALLVVGGGTAFAALLIYYNSVLPEVRLLREEIRTIYKVADIIRRVTRWLSAWL